MENIVDTQQQQTDTVATGLMPMELTQYTPDEVVIYQCIYIGEAWRTFKAWFDENKHWLVELKKRMGVKQGDEGKKMNFNGVMLTWTEFVQKHFGINVSYMRRLMDEKPERKAPDDSDTPNRDELLRYVKKLEEHEAEELIQQINGGFSESSESYDDEEEDVEDLGEAQEPEEPSVLEQATARIRELEAEIETLNVTPDAMELMSEKEKVLAYAKRISGGRAEMLKLVFEEITESLGLSDRITVTVE
jgi:hypothetical protein